MHKVEFAKFISIRYIQVFITSMTTKQIYQADAALRTLGYLFSACITN